MRFMIDTLAAARTLETKGFTKAQASTMSKLRNEIDQFRSELKAEFASLKIWLFASMATVAAVAMIANRLIK